MDHGHRILDAHYVSLYRIMTKSSLSTSFPTDCPSVSKTIGFLG